MKARHQFSSDTEYQKYLRAYYSGLAMQALISGSTNIKLENVLEIPKNTAQWAVACADAMLNKLKE